jgi:hypothetical protein
MLSDLYRRDFRKAIFRLLMSLALLTSFLASEGSAAKAQGVEPPPPAGTTNGMRANAGGGLSAARIAGGLNSAFSWTLNGGYVSAGAAMRNIGAGNIAIAGIPGGSSVQAAYLYWNIISDEDTFTNALGYIDGNLIIGSLIGTTYSPCWRNGWSRSYRADVTSWVTTDPHTYQLTGFASGVTDGRDPWRTKPVQPLLEGASLVIIYNHSSYPSTTVLLYDGAVMYDYYDGFVQTTMTGIPSYQSYLAYATFIVADAQTSSPAKYALINLKKVTAAVFNGTDPKVTGGRYRLGNLWDTQDASTANTAARGISVGKYIPAGSSSVTVRLGATQRDGSTDCVVAVAQVLSVSDGQLDTDGDGLPDSWEANGYKTQNLPAEGANPFHKDVFLQMNWMADSASERRNTHKPSQAVVNALVNAYKTGDVVNPDNLVGIALHVKVGRSIPHARYFSDALCLGLFPKLERVKKQVMAADRIPIYHFQLWVHDLCFIKGSTSGIADSIPGDNSIVSLGSWAQHGTTAERIGTSMHELGHTLNLRHGFPTGLSMQGDGGADDPWTPNHLSIMSYVYQTNGLIKNGVGGLFDYQRSDLPALDESCLNENNGLAGGSALAGYGLAWDIYNASNPDAPVRRQSIGAGTANGPVDWDASGSSETCLSYSINNDTTIGTLQATKEEWKLLVYNGGDVGLGVEYGLDAQGQQIPVYQVDPRTFQELTYQQAHPTNGR